MKLFQTISGLLSEKSSVTITISKLSGPDQKLNVMVIPKINSSLLKDGQNSITPIILKGDGAELDEKFIDTISQPMFKFNETALSIAQLEKDLEEIKGNAKKAATSEKTKTTKETKTSSKTKLDKEEEKEIKTPPLKETNPNLVESKNETKEDSAKERTENRIAELTKLGFEYNKPKLSYVKNSSEIKMRSINLFSDDEYSKLLKVELEKEMKPEKPEGADQVNAFSGNADKVGTKNLNQEKSIQAPSDMLKANKEDTEEKEDFFAPDTDDEKDEKELQPNSDFDSQKEAANEGAKIHEKENSNQLSDDDDISFF